MLEKLDLRWNAIGDRGAIALSGALEVNRRLTRLDVSARRDISELDVGSSHLRRIGNALRRNERALTYERALLNDVVPATRLKVHLCGHGGAGKTTLSSALRRSVMGGLLRTSKSMAADEPDLPEERTRGISVRDANIGGRQCSLWDYAGQEEFHMSQHDFMPCMRGATCSCCSSTPSGRATKASRRCATGGASSAPRCPARARTPSRSSRSSARAQTRCCAPHTGPRWRPRHSAESC